MNEIEQLTNIISDFRKGELDFEINSEHVERWLSQFDESTQPVILSEMVYIFNNWYFSKQSIYEFIKDVMKYLNDNYNIDELYFCNEQLSGVSQKYILKSYLSMDNANNSILAYNNQNHFVYIDDGLYSGSHIRKDIKALIKKYSISQIDIFVMVAYSDGLIYSKNDLDKFATDENVTINLFRWKELQNIKTVEFKDNTESYYSYQDTLWALENTQYDKNHGKIIKDYINKLDRKKDYLFRKPIRKYKSTVFSCEENRQLLEKHFLIKGIEILNESQSIQKGIYPLGYCNYQSLGFGSICAFDFNISNTCPLVLWWGNNKKKNDVLDCWYPLLPRRTNQ